MPQETLSETLAVSQQLEKVPARMESQGIPLAEQPDAVPLPVTSEAQALAHTLFIVLGLQSQVANAKDIEEIELSAQNFLAPYQERLNGQVGQTVSAALTLATTNEIPDTYKEGPASQESRRFLNAVTAFCARNASVRRTHANGGTNSPFMNATRLLRWTETRLDSELANTEP